MKPVSMGHRLREMLGKHTVVLPGVFNGISALLVEEAGFDGVYISGAGLATGVAGIPDIGLLSREEVARQAGYIVDTIRIPAIVDVDTGYGGPIQVMRTVQVFEKLGMAGIQIEDQVEPKRCGHLGGKSLISTLQMAQKIEAAVRAREETGLLIVARTDARGVEGLAAAIERAKAYRDAGADMIFPEALETVQEFEQFAKEVSGWLLANMTEFGKTPSLSVNTFSEMGYAAVIFPMTLLRVMAKFGGAMLADLKREGTQQGWLDRMQTREELYRLIRYAYFEAMDRQVAKGNDDHDT